MENKNMGIAPLVLGIVSVVFAFIVPIVGLICGIIGTVLGVKANKVAPSGMSKGGLVLSINCACRYSSFPCWYDVIDLHQNRQASFPVCLFFIA